MLEFLEQVVSYAIPVWTIVLVLIVVVLSGYLTLSEAFKVFIPSLERSSKKVIENNIAEVEKHFEIIQKRFDDTGKRLDEMVVQHNKELSNGTRVLLQSQQDTVQVLEILKESISAMTTRVEAIQALESEIIKLKHIIKRKS